MLLPTLALYRSLPHHPHPPQQCQLHVYAVFPQHRLQRFPNTLGGLGRDADGLVEGGDFQTAERKTTLGIWVLCGSWDG